MLQLEPSERPNISEIKGYPWMKETPLPSFEEAFMFYQSRIASKNVQPIKQIIPEETK